MRTIKISMIQMKNYYEDQEAGYRAAASMIAQTAARGAELAVLPELSGRGYIPNQSIWQFSEPANGKTAKWACKLSAQLGIYIGAGFIETDGKDFYNSYLISSPSGEISGIIRKEEAESFCFKRCKSDIYIDTAIGRIGIGICADNHFVERLNRMKDANIDFMLMPHASPAPYKTGPNISEKDQEVFEKQPYEVASAYSKYLRVPTIYVNAVGSFPEFMGGFAVKSFYESFRLLGGSLITDSNGELVAKMGSEEGYEVTGITLGNASGEPVTPPVYHGKWLHPGSTVYRYIIMPMLIRKGIRSYNKKHLLYMKTLQKG
jgi:N-carbamoylputrescine amidase